MTLPSPWCPVESNSQCDGYVPVLFGVDSVIFLVQLKILFIIQWWPIRWGLRVRKLSRNTNAVDGAIICFMWGYNWHFYDRKMLLFYRVKYILCAFKLLELLTSKSWRKFTQFCSWKKGKRGPECIIRKMIQQFTGTGYFPPHNNYAFSAITNFKWTRFRVSSNISNSFWIILTKVLTSSCAFSSTNFLKELTSLQL